MGHLSAVCVLLLPDVHYFFGSVVPEFVSTLVRVAFSNLNI